jgi:hypothetical protein
MVQQIKATGQRHLKSILSALASWVRAGPAGHDIIAAADPNQHVPADLERPGWQHVKNMAQPAYGSIEGKLQLCNLNGDGCWGPWVVGA